MNYDKIFVLCPINVITGGSEALHQLVDAINRFHRKAYIVYYNDRRIGVPGSVPLKFRHYDIMVSTNVKCEACNALVVPETKTEFLNQVKNIHKFIWWLSVDFFTSDIETIKQQDVMHLYQSEYARQFLELNNIEDVSPLSDYICYLPESKKNKERMFVAVSLRKFNLNFGKFIDSINSNFQVQVISQLSLYELYRLYRNSFCYVDFGIFSGKDRMVREASHFGCVPILAKNGSVVNNIDFSVQKILKIDSSINSEELVRRISSFSNESQCHIAKINIKTKTEEINFMNEVQHLFCGFQSMHKGRSTLRMKFYFTLEFVLNTVFSYYRLRTKAMNKSLTFFEKILFVSVSRIEKIF